MRALKPRVKISGLVAVLLAGVVLAGVDEAAARGMSNHNVGLGNGRPPALHNNTNHPIVSNPGSGASKPGKHSGKPDKTSSRDHDRGKDRKAEREERRERKAEREREREERKAGRNGETCTKSGSCTVYVGKPSPTKRAPTVTVTRAPTGKVTPSDLHKLNHLPTGFMGGAL
jgi:hypothetical protein